MNGGLDLLGVARYPDTALRALRQIGRPVPIGYFVKFPDGFGDPFDFVVKAVTEKLSLVHRAHGSWADNHRPEDHFERTRIEAKRYDYLALHEPVDLYFDSGCEHRNNPRHKKLQKILAADCPHLIITNNHDDAKFLPRRINEIHGRRPSKPNGPYIVSPDGDSMKGFPWKGYNRRYLRALIRFWWSWHCNGREDMDDHTPRPDRTEWPTVAEIVNGYRLVTI